MMRLFVFAGLGGTAGPVAVAWALMLLATGALAGGEGDQSGAVEMPNPAAAFCLEQGGRYEIRDDEEGARGFCILEDGTEVDAWELYREHKDPE